MWNTTHCNFQPRSFSHSIILQSAASRARAILSNASAIRSITSGSFIQSSRTGGTCNMGISQTVPGYNSTIVCKSFNPQLLVDVLDRFGLLQLFNRPR